MTSTPKPINLFIPEKTTSALFDIDSSAEMRSAIITNTFFVEAIQCGSGYSIGMIDTMPGLYATAGEVETEIAEEQARYAAEIEAGERDDDDEWEGFLMMAKFNTSDPTKLDLYSDGHLISTGSIDDLTGQ
jgi:hypothetical protein